MKGEIHQMVQTYWDLIPVDERPVILPVKHSLVMFDCGNQTRIEDLAKVQLGGREAEGTAAPSIVGG